MFTIITWTTITCKIHQTGLLIIDIASHLISAVQWWNKFVQQLSQETSVPKPYLSLGFMRFLMHLLISLRSRARLWESMFSTERKVAYMCVTDKVRWDADRRRSATMTGWRCDGWTASSIIWNFCTCTRCRWDGCDESRITSELPTRPLASHCTAQICRR